MDQPVGFDGHAAEDARYRLLIDAIQDYAIYMLDPTGHVSSWNPGAQRFKGYKAEEIIGRASPTSIRRRTAPPGRRNATSTGRR